MIDIVKVSKIEQNCKMSIVISNIIFNQMFEFINEISITVGIVIMVIKCSIIEYLLVLL